MDQDNSYCRALGITPPRLESVMNHPVANTYAMLIVILLERGGPVTLEQAAQRMAAAGVAPAERALAALKKSRPARAPIYRDGDLYALDPRDDETDLWAFRLGLRPPKVPHLQIIRPEPRPLPQTDRPISVADLDEAWRGWAPTTWSAQRVAICVLDAHGRAMQPQDVLAFVSARTQWSMLGADSAKHWRSGAAIRVREDGLWDLDRGHDAVRSARQAIRERVEAARRQARYRTDPVIAEACRKRYEARQQAHAEELARLRRVIVHSFPIAKPEAVVLLDIGRHEIATFLGEEIAQARERLGDYDYIAGIEVRALLRSLGFEPGERRLGELGPPQKSKRLNRSGRTLKITSRLLIQGTCGISHPLADPEVLHGYLHKGELTRLRRRLESDAKSIYAFYQYGMLHGCVLLHWGFLDETLPAPWVHADEPRLYHLKKRAHAEGRPLEVVIGSTPGWADPWARLERVQVIAGESPYRLGIVDQEGRRIDDSWVRLARLAGEGG